MPELNGNLTLRQILTILLSNLTQKSTFHFSPDPIRDILWLAEKFERTSNSRHEFSYTSRQTYVKELVLKKYALLQTKVYPCTKASHKPYLLAPHIPIQRMQRIPQPLWILGSLSTPIQSKNSELVLLFRGGLLDQIFGYN